jgi:predicted class III extradiol MEMO1 family dioxygenase
MNGGSDLKSRFVNMPIDKLVGYLNTWKLVPDTTNARLILVPHAALSYSGLCALSAYVHLPKQMVKTVILLCTDHYSGGHTITQDQQLLNNEHSYLVHKALIEYYYGGAVVIEPYLVGTYDQTFAASIASRISNSVIVVATVDFTHYGPNFHKVDFTEPEQIRKQLNETDIIVALQTNDRLNGFTALNNKDFTTCSSSVLRTVLFMNDKLNYTGKVVNYHDSTSVNYDDPLKTLMVQAESKGFVGYCSMVFNEGMPNEITRFDELQLLSNVKSIVDNNVVNGTKFYEHTLLPQWSPWWKKFNGAFVGLSSNGKVRASIGRFQSDLLLPINVFRAAFDCISDAHDRWGPVLTVGEIGQLKYGINILQDSSEWLTYKYEQVNESMIKRGVNGIFLIPTDGNAVTFLPSVWVERPGWSLAKLLEELRIKSGATSLNGSIIRVYTTTYLSVL